MKKILFCFIAVLAACQAEPDLTDRIKIRLKPGDSRNLKVDSRVIYAQRVMDQYETQVLTYQYEMKMEVVEVNKKGYVFKLRYQKIENSIQDANDTLVFSTDDRNAPPFFKSILQADFYLHLSPNGVVTDFSGTEDFNQKLLDLNPDITVEQAEVMLKQINQLFGKEQSMGNFQTLFAAYPKGKVDEENRWESEVSFVSLLPVKYTNHYKLTYENQVGFGITGTNEFETDGKAEFILEGTKMRFELQGQVDSKAVIGKGDGWIQLYEEEKFIDGNMLTYVETQNVYVSIPVRIKVETKLTSR